MTIERIIWVLILGLLAVGLFIMHREEAALRQTFLAGKHEKAYREAALRMFSNSQRVGRKQIEEDFYLAYSRWSDKLCIRLVPKTHMVGGATSYCFDPEPPVRLIGVDQGPE